MGAAAQRAPDRGGRRKSGWEAVEGYLDLVDASRSSKPGT